MEGDRVWLKISPNKGVMWFRKKGKLSPRYIATFDILEHMGEVAYRLAIPPNLSLVYHVFYVSMLQHYIPEDSHMLSLDSVD